jgi:hypothetical protein
MNPMRLPWITLVDLQPQTLYHTAWFLYGWIEREQLLNVSACAQTWMRAIGMSAAQCSAMAQPRTAVPRARPSTRI